MGGTSDIKKGAVIKHQNDLYVVSDFKFVNPGKGSAFTRTKMKSLTSEKTIEITYKSGEEVDVVEVTKLRMQYLYKSGDNYSFMEQDNYETYELPGSLIGDDAKYLKEGLEVFGILYKDSIVALEMPAKIEYKVADAPPAVRGDTSGRMMKDIVLENGLKIKSPVFINPGDRVIVNTDTGEYCERVS